MSYVQSRLPAAQSKRTCQLPLQVSEEALGARCSTCCDEFERPDREVLPIVVDIEGDELAARQQTFLEKFLQIEATREQHIIGIDSVARSFERERCCGGRAGPQVPAQAARRGRKRMLSSAAGRLGSGAACCKPFWQPGAGLHEGSGCWCVQHVCLHGNQALVWVSARRARLHCAPCVVVASSKVICANLRARASKLPC